MKGRFNRLGYLLTHAAMVVIGIGGLLDGNLWLKLKEWRGELAVETRDLSARETPPISRLAPGAIPAFRGNVRLPEGSAANFVFLRVRDGFLVQELPFAIELKEFQVAYYDTGQPKSYTSEVLIHDQEHLGDQPLAATIRVNHPLIYRGYAIYQSDFGDGGSKLELKAWPLATARAEPVAAQGEVGGVIRVGGPTAGALSLELDDFRLFNLLPEPDAQPGDRQFRNFGPSFSFKLRDATGEAREYFNYMAPVQMEGRWFYISGMRAQPGAPFSYLHIPVDANNSPERFLRFNARLRDATGCKSGLFERSADSWRKCGIPARFQPGAAESGGTGSPRAVLRRSPGTGQSGGAGRAIAGSDDAVSQYRARYLGGGLCRRAARGGRERRAGRLASGKKAFFNDAVSALAALPLMDRRSICN